MKICKLCGRKVSELFGPYCSRCDKIVSDASTGLAAELEPIELVL
jgi:hypothetical protein